MDDSNNMLENFIVSPLFFLNGYIKRKRFFNKNIDDSIGLSVLIIKLELNNILGNYIDPTIQRMFSNIILDDEDICYKYIISILIIL